jgi:hypothetical protein
VEWISVVTVLRINKWESVFERAESRKIKTLTWIAWPVNFSSNGYQSLLDEFGDDAAAIYGAWSALCSIAASCAVRGVLATSRGIPLKLSHISRTTGFDVTLFERLVAWATRDDIGWLGTVPGAELAKLIECFNGSINENTASCMSSGESPDDMGDHRGNPCTTRPNLTIPDITKPNITQPDQTGPGPISRGQASDDGLVDRWKTPTRSFLDLVLEIAQRFGRLPDKVRCRVGQELDREFIWQIAWIGAEFDRGVIDDVRDRLASPDVLKPKSYAESVLRKLCSQNGHEWKVLRGLVPAPPPPASRKVAVMEEVNA